ncbi:MAG: hypothetical protein HUJ31_06670 [Pseudomonadales bacterium]|nr:hypothetical protein [Pseudomonadales bacterium]
MIDAIQLRELVIEPTLHDMEIHWPGASVPAAVNLLIGIVFHESLGATYLKQVNGPALGIYQIEPATHQDVWDNYLSYRPQQREFALNLLPRNAGDPSQSPVMLNHAYLVHNLQYATFIARLIVYRKSFEWPNDPNDVSGLATIWKDHYNSNLGAGTENQFIDHYPANLA